MMEGEVEGTMCVCVCVCLQTGETALREKEKLCLWVI